MQLGRSQRNQSDYRFFLATHSTETIWLIDRDYNLLMSHDTDDVSNGEHSFPENARAIVDAALQGQSSYTEQFSDTIGETTLTVGHPVIQNNEITGALLLHAPVAGMQEANRRANDVLLVSLAIGLAVAAVVAFLFSRRLARPLLQMKENAGLMAAGDYSPRCLPDGKDEIADLGRSLDTLGARLQDAADESARMQASRQDFLATISHELRTPVTVLRGLLEACQDGIAVSDDEIREIRQEMLTETTQLERLITDLLELSRLQQDDFKLSKEDVSLNHILEDAVRSASQLAATKQLSLQLEKNSAETPFHGDYGRLKQMFLTVLDNAIRVSPEGETIRLIYTEQSISISDHGPGIPEDELPFIFERYYQGTETKGSSGLGLAIAAAIAARHHIQIEVTSEPGHTVFVFQLRGNDSR